MSQFPTNIKQPNKVVSSPTQAVQQSTPVVSQLSLQAAPSMNLRAGLKRSPLPLIECCNAAEEGYPINFSRQSDTAVAANEATKK